MLSHPRLPFVLSVLVLGGCGGTGPSAGEPEPETAETEQAIQGGYEDGETSGVVGLVIIDASGHSQRSCSGSLIAPNLVLTAQHCVASTSSFVVCDDSTFGPPVSPDRVFITTAQAMWAEGTVFRPVREVVIPEGSARVCGRDIALLVLADPIIPEEATPLSPRLDRAIDLGESYGAVGYGGTAQGASDGGRRRRREGLEVVCVGDDCGAFDHIDRYEWRGDHGICNGDSGGPALDSRGRIFGVTSRGPLGCDDPIYGAVWPWRDWTREVGARALALGGYEPPAWLEAEPWDATADGDGCSVGHATRGAGNIASSGFGLAGLAALAWRRRPARRKDAATAPGAKTC